MSPARGAGRLRVWLACDWFVKYTAGLARGLSEADCEVTLLTRDHDQEFGNAPGAMRSFVSATLGRGGRHLELRGRVRSLSGVAEVRRLRDVRLRWEPDVIHVQDSVANDVRLALASGLLGNRYALTVHDPVPHPGDAISPAPIRAVRRALRRRASLVFVHSEALREEVLASGDVRAPVEVVPHGAGEAIRQPSPARDSLLFFGRMSHYKGLDVLLDAMPLVWAECPEVTLAVAGEGDVTEHPVLADGRVSVRREHIAEEDLPPLFAAATCVVLPYRQASQSGVGSLARQHGRPVIVTAVGGLPELVGREWGRVVPPEDPRALADAILEVLTKPGLADEMGRAANAGLSSEVGWGAVAERSVAAYRQHLL